MLYFFYAVLSCAIGGAALYYTIDFLFYLFDYRRANSAKLSFEQFIAFYKSAPDKWRLKDDYVEYTRNRSGTVFRGIVTESGLVFDGVEPVLFRSYRSLWKYRKWKRRNEKVQAERKRNEKTLSLSKCWAKDVNDAYESAIKEMREMMLKNESMSKRYAQAMKGLTGKYDGTNGG